MGLASCVPTRAYGLSNRAGPHLPFHADRFPIEMQFLVLEIQILNLVVGNQGIFKNSDR